MSAPDPEALAALEEERDFLFRSLDDLEHEFASGDIDEADYRTLKDDYTARAASALRSIDAGRSVPATSSRSARRRRLATVLGVAAVAVLAGTLVAQASGRRGGGGLTGLDVTAASARVGDCQTMEQEGHPEEALGCYSDILESLPTNVDALTYRGWLQIREFAAEDGFADLDAAIQVDPDATAPLLFRAIGRAREGDQRGALDDLAAFYGSESLADEEVALADGFRDRIVQPALHSCIDGEVTGELPAVEVLECYRNVLTVDEDNAMASVYLGWLLARSGVADREAAALLDAGLASDPDLSAGYVFRAALRAHLGDLEGARADLATFAESDPPPEQVRRAAEVEAIIDDGGDPLDR